MSDADDAEVQRSATERLVFFSDAVLAIALTLLAIELPLPEIADGLSRSASARAMAEQARHFWPEYLAFMISFYVIAAHWRGHHLVFRYVARSNHRLVTVNLCWLFLTVITPFTTRLLSEGETNPVRFCVYALTQGLQFGLQAAMVGVIRRNDLFRAGYAESDGPAVVANTHRRSITFTVSFLVSIPVYFFIDSWAFAVWALVPQAMTVLRRVRQRRSP